MSNNDDKRTKGLSDFMRKAFAASVGAVFLTEESLRGYVAEAKLPRDIAKYVLQSSAAAKEQLFEYVSKEVGTLIRRTDLQGLVAKMLESHEIQVEAKIRFKPTGAAEITALDGRAVPHRAAGPAPEAGDDGPDPFHLGDSDDDDDDDDEPGFEAPPLSLDAED